MNRKAVYTNNTTWGKLSHNNQKFIFLAMAKNDPKRIRLDATESQNRIFVSKLRHEKSKTNILKYLKFVQVPVKFILGNKPFSLKYLYKYEGMHIITKLQKDDFFLPLFRKKAKGLFLTSLILKLKTRRFLTH